MTMSMPSDFQGSFLGSRSASTLIGPEADVDAVAVDLDLAGEAAVHAVVAQQVRVVLGREQVVDGDDLQVLAPGLGDGAQHVAADAAEARDCDPDCHGRAPFCPSRRREFSSAADGGGNRWPLLRRAVRHCQYDTIKSSEQRRRAAERRLAVAAERCGRLRSPRRWLTVQVPAPIVGATEGRRRRRRRRTDSSGFHADGPAPRNARRASKSVSAAARVPRAEARKPAQPAEHAGRAAGGASSASAMPSKRSWSAPSARVRHAGGNPGAGARPHRLGPGFPAQHPRGQGLRAVSLSCANSDDLRQLSRRPQRSRTRE